MRTGPGPLVEWARSAERLGRGPEPPVPLFEPFVPLLERRGWRVLRSDATGLVVGTLFAILAMTPSVLPRDWLFQGIVSGISAAAGYGVGVVLGWGVRRTEAHRRAARWVDRSVPARVRSGAWAALVVASPLSLLVVLVVASDSQRQVRQLVHLPAESSAGWLRAAPVIVVLAALLVAVARGLRLLARTLARLLRRWVRLPRGLAQGVSAVAVAVLAVGLIEGVALRWALAAADSSFSLTNDMVPWDTLGTYGQEFVDGGPSPARIAEAAGTPEDDVLLPIRVYGGIEAADTAKERAALAVAELERTGAFARAVICVLPTTGTGWVNSAAPAGLELMYGGDTAVVATQYSYLPSWLFFLFDRERAGEEGAALFDAVSARVEQLPEDDRPRLLVYGESLGTTAGEAAFDGLADIRRRTDGVLWAGPPHSDELWSELVARRDPGTAEAAPVYADGLVVRFGNEPGDLLKPGTTWLEPRIAYLMHPSDPVVWWSWDLLFARPDWLEEPRGEGVPPAMSWYPVVTFWQVTADLTDAASPPMGFGHNYGAQLLDAWAVVAPPSGWTGAATDRARGVFLD